MSAGPVPPVVHCVIALSGGLIDLRDRRRHLGGVLLAGTGQFVEVSLQLVVHRLVLIVR